MRVSDMYFSRLSKYFPRGKLLSGLGGDGHASDRYFYL